ncbi:MAG: hypothetical protein V7L01_10500 [Nostoc sp.]|uniref:hypothetical protein n=1 Tax=Nostoc sp. TaxID=1180 RepID=UPI002FF5E6A9
MSANDAVLHLATALYNLKSKIGVAYLRDDFVSFVGWASCPSLVFQGARVAHPTRIIP